MLKAHVLVLRVIGWWIVSDATCPMCITFVGWTSEWLGSHVGKHLFGFNVFCFSIFTFLLLLTKGGMDAEILCSGSHSTCRCDGFYRFVVLVDCDGLRDVVVDRGAEVTKDFGSKIGATEAS